MFARISNLNDLLPYIENNKQIRVKVDESTGFTVVCYMVQDEDTFDGDNPEFAIECRGITFDREGKIAARTLSKFFNVGERESTLPTALKWGNVSRIMEKRDGSMITPVLVDGKIKCKTKKSFTTPEAACADEVIANTVGGAEWIARLLSMGHTPTFEITSPRFPIVVRYEKDELTLLHIRSNESGMYWSMSAIEQYGCPFPVVQGIQDEFIETSPPNNFVSWELLKQAAEKTEGMEGWVIQFKDGEMVKLKTAWYIELHHSVTFTRWRDVARTVCADQSDDLKAAFAMVGRPLEPILEVERKVHGYINALQNAVELHASNGKALNRTAKDMALALRDRPDFSLIMRAFRDQEVNYMEYYIKHQLELDWGLEVIPS